MEIECKNCAHAVDYQEVADPTNVITICEIFEEEDESDDNYARVLYTYLVDGIVFSKCNFFLPREEERNNE